MDIPHLEAFLAAARHLHFTRAAASLGIAQPTLSLQIQQLERELATPLFDRVGRTVRLTQAGELLRRHSASALATLDNARHALADLGGLRAGTLRLGVTHILATWLLPEVLSAFHRDHPAVQLFIEKLTSRRVEDRLLSGELDLGVTFSPPNALELLPETLFTERVVVALPKRHPLAGRRSLDLAQLAEVPLLLTTREFATRRLLDEAARDRSLTLKIAMELNDIDLLLALVRQGAGATILARRALGRASHLALVALTRPALTHTASLLWHRDRYRTAAGRAFADLLRGAARRLPA